MHRECKLTGRQAQAAPIGFLFPSLTSSSRRTMTTTTSRAAAVLRRVQRSFGQACIGLVTSLPLHCDSRRPHSPVSSRGVQYQPSAHPQRRIQHLPSARAHTLGGIDELELSLVSHYPLSFPPTFPYRSS